MQATVAGSSLAELFAAVCCPFAHLANPETNPQNADWQGKRKSNKRLDAILVPPQILESENQGQEE
jgi:hypothetical protein